MPAKRPTVTLRCPADQYHSPGERIVEFSDSRGRGGLISLRETDDRLIVEVYRCDATVAVRWPADNREG